MQKFLFLLFCTVFSVFTLKSQIVRPSGAIKLSNDSRISILTSSPSNDEIFTVFGHTAIRVLDRVSNIDIVFNYGVFDTKKPNFMSNFIMGKTDYELENCPTVIYLPNYEIRGSGVFEQVLNLNQAEKQKLLDTLFINNLPQNKEYRYNFFFDNCATRVVSIIESVIDIEYHEESSNQTFRELVNHCMAPKPWMLYGCQLALGTPVDRIASFHEEMFLPSYLKAQFDKATISDGRKLVVEGYIIVPEGKKSTKRDYFTPIVCSLILLILTIVLIAFEWKKRRFYHIFDFLLCLTAGLIGCVIFFLAFFSEHPGVYPNWLVIWLSPIHLIGALLFRAKKTKITRWNFLVSWTFPLFLFLGEIIPLRWYFLINCVTILPMLLCWSFIPQDFHIALLPFMLCLLLRSAHNLLNGGRAPGLNLRYNEQSCTT